MAQYANPQQFGAPTMGEDGQYMQQVDQKLNKNYKDENTYKLMNIFVEYFTN